MPVFGSIRVLGLILGIIFVSSSTFGSTITPQNTSVTVVSNASFPADYVHIVPPNSTGMSFNRFNTFRVNTKPLHILNPGSQGTTPTTVVIIADDFELRNTVEVVGDAADLVFVSQDRSGQFECIGCSILNAFRVTMAINSNYITRGSGSLELGNLDISPTGNVSIENLAAPGAINVDLMAGNITTRGTIDLLQRADKHASDGFVSSANGRYRIGSGVLQLLAGDFRWDYDDQLVLGNRPTVYSSSIGGTVRSAGFKLLTSGPADISAVVDTRTDAVASVRYRGDANIVQERLIVQDFSQAGLNLSNARFSSNGSVNVGSVNSLHIPANARFQGGDIELISKYRLSHSAQTRGKNIHFAGSTVVNEGLIKASANLEGFGESQIVNRSGGYIQGDIVHLEAIDSTASIVLNGSRTPYQSDVQSHFNINSGYFDALNPTKLGSFYFTETEMIRSRGSRYVPPKTSAQIRGRRILIKTRAFENVNPYYVAVDQDSRVASLNRLKATQIATVAEENLSIEADNYILNSSALLGSEKQNSLVHLDAGIIINERYRIYSTLDYQSVTESGVFILSGTYRRGEPEDYSDSTTTERVLTSTVAISPPGLLYSMGNFRGRASELFLNSVAYFEVFGDAEFSTPKLVDAGLEHQSVRKEESVRNYASFSSVTQSSNETIVDPSEIDSLFYVAGNANAREAHGSTFRNLSPFKHYLNESIHDILLSEYGDVGTGERLNSGYSGDVWNGEYSSNQRFSLDVDEDFEFGVFDITWSESVRRQLPSRPDEHLTLRASDTKQYSIFDTLKNKYDSMVESVSDFFNELKWW